MKKTSCVGYIGDNTTQLYGDYKISNQAVFFSVAQLIQLHIAATFPSPKLFKGVGWPLAGTPIFHGLAVTSTHFVWGDA